MYADKIYPEYAEREEPFCGPWDYQPILNGIGKVVVQVDDDDYQDDSRVLFTAPLEVFGSIGFLVFGWGSCSGCDALQRCETMEELQELIDDLERSVKWFPNKAAALEWFEGKDWEVEWYWHYEEFKEFLTKAKEYLRD